MALNPGLEAVLKLIEGRQDIGGRYTNLRRVGTDGGGGTFSLVFEAKDKQTGTDVAVKVFRHDQLSSLSTYRYECFCREARMLEKLSGSPHILGWVGARQEFVEQVQTTTGIQWPFRFPYFVVELAADDVGNISRSGKWGPERKLVAFREMCKGVQRIHRHGIAHRDIKPSNFLVVESGEVKLSDFGTARYVNGSEPPILDNYAAPPGDLRYSAPELHALLHDEDPAIALKGDMFALGATLFELWSGTILGIQLFRGTLAQDLAQAMAAVPKRDRRRVYLQTVQSIDAGHPLPPLSAYGNVVPGSIRDLLESLYKGLSTLDYRHRLCDFERVFLKIDQCVVVLRNEEKVARWRGQREIYRQKREEKHDSRRAKTIGKTGELRC